MARVTRTKNYDREQTYDRFTDRWKVTGASMEIRRKPCPDAIRTASSNPTVKRTREIMGEVMTAWENLPPASRLMWDNIYMPIEKNIANCSSMYGWQRAKWAFISALIKYKLRMGLPLYSMPQTKVLIIGPNGAILPGCAYKIYSVALGSYIYEGIIDQYGYALIPSMLTILQPFRISVKCDSWDFWLTTDELTSWSLAGRLVQFNKPTFRLAIDYLWWQTSQWVATWNEFVIDERGPITYIYSGGAPDRNIVGYIMREGFLSGSKVFVGRIMLLGGQQPLCTLYKGRKISLPLVHDKWLAFCYPHIPGMASTGSTPPGALYYAPHLPHWDMWPDFSWVHPQYH